jgi:type IV secretory pathway VirB2 component (pilin)
MTMSGPALGTLLAQAANPLGPTAAEIAGWQSIATALVSYIQGNASVTTTVIGTASGVTSGPSTASVTGTASGTIS